ncbi:glutamine synthetase beta-grasp domain-containing protein, partial [Catenulispora sp. NL8]
MVYKAEYIWVDGAVPTAGVRSKTRVLADGVVPGVWGFDGSSTGQAVGHSSDRVLRPVFTCADPVRGGAHVLVLCEVEGIDFVPHGSNMRAGAREVAERFAGQDVWFGIEQEYTLFRGGRPLGFPEGGFPAAQGPYYC